jgi:hypothetical protein
MKPLLTASAVVCSCLLASAARAQPIELKNPVVPLPRAPLDKHPVPRLKLSFVRFNVGPPNAGSIALDSLHLDVYALSRRWVRLGVDVEGGLGHTKLGGASTSLKYALLGVSAGMQWPGRITPFIEGRIAAGVLARTLNDASMIPGASGASAPTWMWARGLDVGVEVYTFGRAYVSAGIGWIRTTYRGADYDGARGLTLEDVTSDSFMFKLGFGI